MAKRTTRGSQSRQARAKSRKPVGGGEVEVVEEAGGLGIDAGIVIATAAMLVIGLLVVDALMGKLDKGMFF